MLNQPPGSNRPFMIFLKAEQSADTPPGAAGQGEENVKTGGRGMIID